MSILEVDPKEFIITRKRKLYKFALFANSRSALSLTSGSGVLSMSLNLVLVRDCLVLRWHRAIRKKTFVAVDVKADRLQKGAYTAVERSLTNIFFVRARADQLTEMFPADSLESLWITFPDPFPKSVRRAAA